MIKDSQENLNEVNKDSDVKPWFDASMAYCIYDNNTNTALN